MDNMSSVPLFRRVLRSKAFTLFILLAFIVLVFSVLAPLKDATFFTFRTFLNIFYDLAVPSFLGIGASCLLVSGAIDLSSWTVGALTGVIMAIGISWWGLPWYVCMLIALACAALIGFLNATFVSKLGMAPFIATMAMASIVRGINMLIATDKQGVLNGMVNYENATLHKIAYFEIAGIPLTVILMIIAFVAYGLMLSKSKMGRHIYMLGGNMNAARLAGIKAGKLQYFLFMNCSILASISGMVYTMRAKQGSTSMMSAEQFTGMTAAMLGGISFGGGSGGLGGAFVGLFVIKTFNKGMLIVSSNTFLASTTTGVLLLAALTFDYINQRRQNKRVGA